MVWILSSEQQTISNNPRQWLKPPTMGRDNNMLCKTLPEAKSAQAFESKTWISFLKLIQIQFHRQDNSSYRLYRGFVVPLAKLSMRISVITSVLLLNLLYRSNFTFQSWCGIRSICSPLADLATRLHHLHCHIASDCLIGSIGWYWVGILVSAKLTSVKSAETCICLRHLDQQIGPGIPGSDENWENMNAFLSEEGT